ncbi:hypothetical protein AAKU55_005343 [Oxalobacteraceae bacterium GrIS 1.11]
MSLKQSISFTTSSFHGTANFAVTSTSAFDWEADHACHALNITSASYGAYINFNINLVQSQEVSLILQLSSSVTNGQSNCPINIYVNGQPLISKFDPHIGQFYSQVWPIPASMLAAGDNSLTVSLDHSATTPVFVGLAAIDLFQPSTAQADWLSCIADHVPIGNISIAGTHDSAAINASVLTPYACQRFSISQQLNGGIRLLDVRLKVTRPSDVYVFMTCHGNIGVGVDANVYQSFVSLLDECKAFLNNHPKETIIISLKIDDRGSYNLADFSDQLCAVLLSYPIAQVTQMPTLGQVRGKIVLFNRITTPADSRFGFPLNIPDNTSGTPIFPCQNRPFQVFVQDQYEDLSVVDPNAAKLKLVIHAISKKTANNVVWNFASATFFKVIGVYVMQNFLREFGYIPGSNRASQLGWILFDFPFEQYNSTLGYIDVVNFIISSNHEYYGFANTFTLIGHDDL